MREHHNDITTLKKVISYLNNLEDKKADEELVNYDLCDSLNKKVTIENNEIRKRANSKATNIENRKSNCTASDTNERSKAFEEIKEYFVNDTLKNKLIELQEEAKQTLDMYARKTLNQKIVNLIDEQRQSLPNDEKRIFKIKILEEEVEHIEFAASYYKDDFSKKNTEIINLKATNESLKQDTTKLKASLEKYKNENTGFKEKIKNLEQKLSKTWKRIAVVIMGCLLAGLVLGGGLGLILKPSDEALRAKNETLEADTTRLGNALRLQEDTLTQVRQSYYSLVQQDTVRIAQEAFDRGVKSVGNGEENTTCYTVRGNIGSAMNFGQSDIDSINNKIKIVVDSNSNPPCVPITWVLDVSKSTSSSLDLIITRNNMQNTISGNDLTDILNKITLANLGLKK